MIQHTVTAGIPLLVPKAISADYQAALIADANGFSVVYTSVTQAATVELATSQPVLPSLHAGGSRSNQTFRGVGATSQIDDSTPNGPRWLYWSEPSGNTVVPYSLLSDGLTEAEFWQVADSLGPIGLGSIRECTASDLHAVTGHSNGAGQQTFNTILFSNHSGTSCQLNGTPTIVLRTVSGQTISVPQANSLMPWMTSPAAPAEMTAASPDPQPDNPSSAFGQAYVDFSMWDCPADPIFSTVSVNLPNNRGTVTVPGSGIAYSWAGCDGGGHVARMVVAPFVGTSPEPDYIQNSSLSITLKAPSTVRAGGSLHYQVVLTNTSGAPFRFHDCPNYAEDASRPGAKIVPTYQLNCQSVGWVAPNGTVTFDMVLAIPVDSPASAGQLRWRMGSAYGMAQAEAPLTIVAP